LRDGQASVTARRVAAHRLSFARPVAAFGDPDSDDALARDVAADVDVSSTSERMVAYLHARTSFFDRVVLAELDRGVGQVVVVAAGYDGRSLRYRSPGVTWFELDHPDTQQDKRQRLARLGIESAGVSFVAADFRHDDIGVRLAAAGVDRTQTTLFTVEGVVAYLDRSTIMNLFTGLRAVAHAGSRAAVSLSTTAADGTTSERRDQLRRVVSSVGEPLAEPLTPDDAADLLPHAGWRELSADESQPGLRRAGLVLLAPVELGQGSASG
jgi:methyltransferase (TIGR00027 family)